MYRFPNVVGFEQMVGSMGETELELGLPAGEAVADGEWVLAVFDLGAGHRATSAAARAALAPEGARLVFEPRDWQRLAEFAQSEALRTPSPTDDDEEKPPLTARSAGANISNPPTGTGARVLIVDDDPDIRDMVSVMLEAVGLQ